MPSQQSRQSQPQSQRSPTPPGPQPVQSPYSQMILWTALPAGYKIVNGQKLLRLHVHIAPRLQIAPIGQPSSPTLQMFNDFAKWPGNFGSKGMSFTVQFFNTADSMVSSIPNVRPTPVP